MSYFGFLARFVVIPLAAITFLLWRDRRAGKPQPDAFGAIPEAATLAGLVGVAIAYTTPWDNYLVATRIWWYDPKLVTGIVLGWVPIEEYTFFILQTLLTGSWVLWLSRRVPHDPSLPKHPWRFRLGMAAALGVIWAASTYRLFFGTRSEKYLTLTLSWALIPIIFQALFGGDILWQHRRLIALGIVPATLYLASADSLAIGEGTWQISEEQTVNVNLAGRLPLEEGLFFLLTNVLVSFGVVLTQAHESPRRIPQALRRWLLGDKRAAGDDA